MTSDDKTLDEYQAEVLAEMIGLEPVDPGLERFDRRTFVSRRRGRWNGWRYLKDGTAIHRERRESAREVRSWRNVDLILDRWTGKVWNVRNFPWDDLASETYPGDPDAEARLIEVLGGEQEVPFYDSDQSRKFGDRRGLGFFRS